MKELIANNARQLQELYVRIKETYKLRPHGPEHHAACDEFHRRYDALAFPGGCQLAIEKLAQNDDETIELAIQFLEADPWFFRSGYLKELFLRKLKKSPLSKNQLDRLANLIIRSVDSGHREFRYYARLAGVIHPEYLLEAVKARLSATNDQLRRRAEQLTQVLMSRGIIPKASLD